MNKRHFLLFNIPLAMVFCLLLTACPNNEKFGADADYFIGLQKLAENNTKEAMVKFNSCIKKGTFYCAKESAKQLAQMGNLQEKNAAAEFLYQNFPAPDTLLILAQQYHSSGENRKLLEITQNIDFAKDDNELIKLRLNTLLALNLEEQFCQEVYTWFTSRALSQEQYQFFRDIYAPMIMPAYDLNPAVLAELSPKDFAIAYRIILYRRDYLTGYVLANQLLTLFDEQKLEPAAYLASDIGKSFLYGSEQIVKDAVRLRTIAGNIDNAMTFYFWFYAGRLYDGANLYYKQAITCYENAIAATDQGSKQDNALWYLLRTRLKLSLDSTLADMGKYARSWHDPEYFDDFFDTLIPSLVVNGKWDAFKKLSEDIDGYASKEITAQLSYLYARLLEMGYIQLEDEDQKPVLIKAAYTKALDCGSSVYYKILAAYKMNYSGKDLENLLGLKEKTEEEAQTPSPADNLLNGYAYFGFPEKIYPAWLELYNQDVSVNTSMYISEFLSKCAAAQKNDDYYVQALRIASRSYNRNNQPLTVNQLKNVYPQNFNELVDTYSKKYDINTSVIYALIRSESFFDKEIVSSAGAVGLTQLMSPTAAEIAQKLRIKEYELTDPETNIWFGTYYLSELIRRGNGSLLRAFFSYNAGFRKVTTWLNSSMLEFGKSENMDMDLFLETVPVSETREYGRKLIGATVMYEYLYKNSDFSQTVESLLK
ncbi:MAG: lytic transglycosylase domain-containing protein [Treponema sp.]|nr:lytic transglycosylase domain-containing protein [Treponema sp.]